MFYFTLILKHLLGCFNKNTHNENDLILWRKHVLNQIQQPNKSNRSAFSSLNNFINS